MQGVAPDQLFQAGDLLFIGEAHQGDHLLVAAVGEVAGLIKDIGHPARHAGAEITTGGPQDDYPAAGHIFTAMVPQAFDNGFQAAVTHTETLAGQAADKGLPGRGAIEGDVASDDVFRGVECRFFRRIDDDFAARQPLTQVIIGLAGQGQGQTVGDKSAKTLSGRTVEEQGNGIFG